MACRKDIGLVNIGNYPNDIGKLITANCATSGCHNDKSYKAAANLNLTTWNDLFTGSNGGSAVIPFSSKFSFLCNFINTYPDLGLTSQPTMPINKPPLSKDEVKKIMDWVDAGAPNINGEVMWANNIFRKKVYVVNQGCDVVTVIDSETQLPMRYIEVGNKPGSDTPHSVRVSPDGEFWYVVFINNNIMQKYRCSDDSYIGDIPLTPKAAGTNASIDGFDWNTMIISKDGRKAYCVSWVQSGRVAAVDLVNRKLLHFLPNLNFPHGVALSPNDDTLYVAAATGNYISEIDTAFSFKNEYSLQPFQSVNYSSSLDMHDMVLTPDGKNLVVTCQKTNEIRVFDRATHDVSTISTGVYPQEIVYSKSTNRYFVSCPYDSTTFSNSMGVVSAINANFIGNATHIKVGFQPHGIGVDNSKKLLYVVSRNILTSGPAPHHTNNCGGRNGFVNFIDMQTLQVLPKKYELSSDPYFVFARYND